VTADSEVVETARSGKIRKLHKALLRYHAPENWEIIHEALVRMGRRDLIGSGPRHLIPARQPVIPITIEESGVANGRRVAAPKINTFGKKTTARATSASAAKPTTTPARPGLAYKSAKPKTTTAKTGRR